MLNDRWYNFGDQTCRGRDPVTKSMSAQVTLSNFWHNRADQHGADDIVAMLRAAGARR